MLLHDMRQYKSIIWDCKLGIKEYNSCVSQDEDEILILMKLNQKFKCIAYLAHMIDTTRKNKKSTMWTLEVEGNWMSIN